MAIQKPTAPFRLEPAHTGISSLAPLGREEFPPREIIEAERKVSMWFAERNIREWKLGGSRSR